MVMPGQSCASSQLLDLGLQGLHSLQKPLGHTLLNAKYFCLRYYQKDDTVKSSTHNVQKHDILEKSWVFFKCFSQTNTNYKRLLGLGA